MRRSVFVFLLCIFIVVSRRPDVVFHAQFWAEDGKFWYADAYNLGAFQPFLHPAAGYFQTLPRLAALAAQFFPLSMAPFILNVIAIVIQVLPAQFLLSSRCRELGSFAARSLFAFLYLALPNSQEMHGNITNAYWRFAFLALLILFAQPGRTAWWNLFDFGVLTLCALTGPLIIFIAPIAAVLYLLESRNRWRLALLWISGTGALVEVLTVAMAGGSERIIHAMRGATPQLLIQILAKQVFLAVVVGRRTITGYSFGSGSGLVIAAIAVTAGIAIELYVLVRAPFAWKAFILFSVCILGASLAYPMTSASPQWPSMLGFGGVRYWFFPMLAFVASVVWMLHVRNPAFIRGAGLALLIVMFFGIVQDWGHPRPVDLHFQAYANAFAELPSGRPFSFPLNPIGWTMELMKR